MNLVKFYSILFYSLFAYALACPTVGSSEKFYPASILQVENHIGKYTIVAEKSTHSLFVFKTDLKYPELLARYSMATGKIVGNKRYMGDAKTPEGIYRLTFFHTQDFLLDKYGENGKQYGLGAFTLDYPNFMDQKWGKTGGGIWIHSTNDASRISKGLDSRGCIVINDQNLTDISKYINLGQTYVVVVQDLHYINEKTWNNNRNSLYNTIYEWKQSWENEDLEKYISFYINNYSDFFRKSLNQFKNYKRSIFAQPGKPKIDFNDLTILQTEKYARINFTQKYSSNTITDIGSKTLFLKKDKSYQWKIINENWSKINNTNSMASPFAYLNNRSEKNEKNSNISVGQVIQ